MQGADVRPRSGGLGAEALDLWSEDREQALGRDGQTRGEVGGQSPRDPSVETHNLLNHKASTNGPGEQR
jgi:hypothetical protein